MSNTSVTHAANTRRSLRLFRLFLKEQTEPDLFYSAFAQDSVSVMSDLIDLTGRTVLDVGGGPGFFAREFSAAGAHYVGVELDIEGDDVAQSFAVRGSGTHLPVRSGAVDVAYCSNVLEHVRDAWRVADELVRVTRPGGIVFLSFTPWLSPWGGHETAPWHYRGGRWAADRYAQRWGHRPKNDFGHSLFAHRAGTALRWARARPDVEIVRAYPRYHPRWAWWIAAVPGVREVLSWNYVLVLRRT